MYTNEAVLITWVLQTSWGVTCSKVIGWRDWSWLEYDANRTDETVRIETSRTNFEYAVCSASSWALTFSTRGLDSTDTKVSVASNIKQWRPWAVVKLVASASDLIDKDSSNTVTWDNTFTWSNTFDEPVVLWAWVESTEYATEAARDTALWWDWVATKAYSNIYVTATSLHYNYNLWSAQWEEVETWTVTPNASETVAGKVEKATDVQFLAWDSTGETWAFLFATPEQVINKTDALQSDIDDNSSSIWTNTSNIGTNTSNISTNASNIPLFKVVTASFQSNTATWTINYTHSLGKSPQTVVAFAWASWTPWWLAMGMYDASSEWFATSTLTWTSDWWWGTWSIMQIQAEDYTQTGTVSAVSTTTFSIDRTRTGSWSSWLIYLTFLVIA